MSLGPIMMDLQGVKLSPDEREMLIHPLVGGVILFSRNYESVEQLSALTQELHGLRDPHLIIAVDHEGGRIQRFRDGFTPLPPMSALGDKYKADQETAREIAEQAGWVLAAELLECGLDISFSPVLDINFGCSGVIGDRAFDRDPEVITVLAGAVMRGMRRAGMAATGKHFPGHGGVKEDSHIAHPVDSRSLEDLLLADILPFERLIHAGLAGIMPAHVVYEKVDPKPAGYSQRWLQEILRKRLGFQGVIFSDDLSMIAADCGDGYIQRARSALQAGCDMVLVCNQPQAVAELLEGFGAYTNPASQMRLVRMHGKRSKNTPNPLRQSKQWQEANKLVASLNEQHTLELNL